MNRRLALVNPGGAEPDRAPVAFPLLETKLYPPRWHPGQVSRTRLLHRIDEGVRRRLTVVSAPAGSGKTTLLAEWLTTVERSAAWVSLDATENEPGLFWAYVMHALQRVEPALEGLTHPPATMDAFLPTLVNAVAAGDDEIILILDDYHVVESADVHRGVKWLIEHLPPRMHLVIASRSEPPLSLARLRARGELTELRPQDLRFTTAEAAAFLNQAMSLDIPAGDIAALESRTEGWIAGLKLAALSLQGRSDMRAFIESFSGDNRYIADYLIEEVVDAQPERVQRFLLATSILDRLSAPLCDAVTDEPGSHAVLDSLERSNLFIVGLDDRRQWYRYHHMFADVLQSYAQRVQPERFRLLHQRASAWYEQQGATNDAVHHALAAHDLHRAAGLLERTWAPKDRSYAATRWLERVKALPEPMIRDRPVLAMGYAWALLNAGELEPAAAWIGIVEQSLQTPTSPHTISDDAHFLTLPAELASARIYLAQCRGDVDGTIEHAQRTFDAIPVDDHMARATGAALLALAHWTAGSLEVAHRTFASALASMRAAGRVHDEVRGIFVLGDIRAAQGRLDDAAATYEEGLRHAAGQPPGLAVTDELCIGLSEVHRERDELEQAAALLHTYMDPATRAEHVRNRHGWCIAMARIAHARGDHTGALLLLEEAESVEVRGPLPRLRPIEAMKARAWLALGRLADAEQWVQARNLTIHDELRYITGYEHVTLARVLIARTLRDDVASHARDAITLLERLATAADRGGRNASLIEMLVLQAIAHHALRDMRAAMVPLERALTLAAAEGHVRVFADEGPPMRELLRHAAARGVHGAYTRRLLQAMEPAPQPAPAAPAVAGKDAPLLTTRELEILRLIAAGLRNQEIADQLFISPATVKRHIANAYNKLGAGHRTEALARAQERKLL